MTIDLVAPVGRPIAPAHPPAGRKEREAHLAEQVAEILGDRLDGERAAIAAAAAARWVVSDFRQFQIWARSFDYGELPACGAVVACYLMALMNTTGSLRKVRRAACAIGLVHAASGCYLDAAYVKATRAWARDFCAGAELLLQPEET
jgi:hypothetical protein